MKLNPIVTENVQGNINHLGIQVNMEKVWIDRILNVWLLHVIEMNTGGLKNSNWNEHSDLKNILG